MKPVVWSKESIKSIQDIYDYISSESEQNADMVIDTLFDIGEKLNILPEKNPVEPFLILIQSVFFQNGIIKWCTE